MKDAKSTAEDHHRVYNTYVVVIVVPILSTRPHNKRINDTPKLTVWGKAAGQRVSLSNRHRTAEILKFRQRRQHGEEEHSEELPAEMQKPRRSLRKPKLPNFTTPSKLQQHLARIGEMTLYYQPDGPAGSLTAAGSPPPTSDRRHEARRRTTTHCERATNGILAIECETALVLFTQCVSGKYITPKYNHHHHHQHVWPQALAAEGRRTVCPGAGGCAHNSGRRR